MKNSIYRNLCGLLFLTSLIFLGGCDKQDNQGNGFLEGIISIGPICPVETFPPKPECLPTAETYKAYPVYVCSPDGSKKIELISPALNGSFKMELATGKYLIVLDRAQHGIGGSNLPQEVQIKASVTTVINVDIDTGIR